MEINYYEIVNGKAQWKHRNIFYLEMTELLFEVWCNSYFVESSLNIQTLLAGSLSLCCWWICSLSKTEIFFLYNSYVKLANPMMISEGRYFVIILPVFFILQKTMYVHFLLNIYLRACIYLKSFDISCVTVIKPLLEVRSQLRSLYLGMILKWTWVPSSHLPTAVAQSASRWMQLSLKSSHYYLSK